MAKDKKTLMMELVTADVVSAITEETSASVPEAMRMFYNSEAFDRLCDPETGLYRESGGYVYELYKNWHMIDDGLIL
ncbi:MAG: hypothetical protein FWD88_07195 [Treponema sp.]|nr:hypothetical protein [Treponema sp.]